MPRLENWCIVLDNNITPYTPPECIKRRLAGNIHNDEKGRFVDGEYVTTSSLQDIDLNKKIARTKNTTYELGRMSASYQEWLDENGYKVEDFVGKVSE
jgi:hypothetical protein